MIVRIHAGTDYQPGLIQKLFIIIIMILLCNPQERVTANWASWIIYDPLRDPWAKNSSPGQEAASCHGNLTPKRAKLLERWFKSKHMRRNVALHNQAARQTQDMYVKKTYFINTAYL